MCVKASLTWKMLIEYLIGSSHGMRIWEEVHTPYMLCEACTKWIKIQHKYLSIFPVCKTVGMWKRGLKAYAFGVRCGREIGCKLPIHLQFIINEQCT